MSRAMVSITKAEFDAWFTKRYGAPWTWEMICARGIDGFRQAAEWVIRYEAARASWQHMRMVEHEKLAPPVATVAGDDTQPAKPAR